MTDNEFAIAVERVYASALAAGKTPLQASKAAQAFRSNLIVSLAKAANDRRKQS